MSSSCPLLRGTHIRRVFWGGVYLVVYVLFICVYLFHEEPASPRLFRFWCLLSYLLAFSQPSACLSFLPRSRVFRHICALEFIQLQNLLSSDSLHDLLIYLLCPAGLRKFLFYEERVSPGLYVFEFTKLSTCFLRLVCVTSVSSRTAHLLAI